VAKDTLPTLSLKLIKTVPVAASLQLQLLTASFVINSFVFVTKKPFVMSAIDNQGSVPLAQ
jgi:hypothetical protein